MGDKPDIITHIITHEQTTEHRSTNIPSNLVPQRFARDNGNLFTDPLVGVEVQRQSSVVLLDDQLGGLLDGFRTNATLHMIKRPCFNMKFSKHDSNR
jgi:hypothetical protein